MNLGWAGRSPGSVHECGARRVEPGGRGTLVGTGFLNRAMPFLRYATDDRATLLEGACRCGRAYPRLSGIEGRWEGELLYGNGGASFSMTALNTHAGVFARVQRFRIRQERVGEALVLVVPGSGFGDLDAAQIRIGFGGGELNLRPAQPGALVDGQFEGGVRQQSAGPGHIELSPQSPGLPIVTWAPVHWEVGITTEIPVDLRLDSAA